MLSESNLHNNNQILNWVLVASDINSLGL